MSNSLWRKVFGPKSHVSVLIAPSYDSLTHRTFSWARTWNFEAVTLYGDQDATHGNATASLTGPVRTPKVLMFVGHGQAAGLLTQPGLGKSSSPICGQGHECLLDSEDLIPGLRGVNVVAWACKVGFYFGRRTSTLKDSAFLGFNENIKLVVNDGPSEQLWSSVMYEVFERIAEKGRVESHDAEWLKILLLETRKKIRRGELDTGRYNRINSIFLKSAARHVCVYVKG